jgi:hypothetical protein
MTNDDPNMMLRMSGVFVLNQPTTNILFSSVFIAKPMVELYKLAPSLPWYALYYFLVLCLSFTTISHAIFKMFGKKRALLYILLIYFLFGPTFFTVWQFTMLAGISFISGFIAFQYYWLYCINKKIKANSFTLISGLAMLALSSLIRYQIFIGSMIISLPLTVYYVLHHKDFKHCLRLLIVTGGCIVLNQINIYVYNTENDNYYNYNVARATAAEFRPLDLLAIQNKNTILKSVNWTDTDVLGLNNCFFFDDDKFSYDKLQHFADVTPIKLNFSKFFEIIRWHASYYFYYFFQYSPFIFIPFFLVVSKKRSKAIFNINLLMFFWCYTVITVIAIIMKYPDFRAQYPLLVLTCLCCFFHTLIYFEDWAVNYGKRNLLAILFITDVLGLIYTTNKYSTDKLLIEKRWNNFLVNANSNRPIIGNAWTIPLETINPYISPLKLKKYNAFFLGCFQQSKQDKAYLKSFGAENIEDAVYKKHFPVTVLHSDSALFIGFLTYYAKRDLNIQVNFTPLYDDGNILLLRVASY